MANLLVIGAAGLDWAGFVRRRGEGGLPALEALRRRGVAGAWPALPAPAEPAAWGCLVTGQPPEAHGLWRSTEAFGGGVRPATRAAWAWPPLWAALTAAGVATASVDWPGSRPGAAWSGVHLDEDFAQPSGRHPAEWALPLRCAPADPREALRDIRVHPTEITGEMLKPFAPALASIDQSRDTGLPRLALAMSRAATVQAGAEWILRRGSAEAVFVRQPWLGQVRGAFEGARAPFDGVVDAAWRFADGLIGYLAALAGPGALVVMASPGWASRPGFLLAAGPGVAADPEPQTWDMLDLAPTLLARFGLVDDRLPGRRIESISPARALRAAPEVSPETATEPDQGLLEAAVAAGYAAPPPASAVWRARGLAELAALILPRAPDRAGAIAAAALEVDPGDVVALSVRAMASTQTDDPEPLPELAAALTAAAPGRGWGALAQGAYHVMRSEVNAAAPWLVRAEADPETETRLRVAAAWLAAQRPADAERVFRAVLEREPENASAEVGLAVTAQAGRDFLAAEQSLLRALRHDPGRVAAHLELARVYAATGRSEMAQRASASALRLGAAAEEVSRARSGAASPLEEG